MKRQCTGDVISFFDDNLWGVQTPYADAIIVSMMIANYDTKKNLIDNESSIDILVYDTF